MQGLVQQAFYKHCVVSQCADNDHLGYFTSDEISRNPFDSKPRHWSSHEKSTPLFPSKKNDACFSLSPPVYF